MTWHTKFKSKGCILKLKADEKAGALDEMVDQLVSSKLLAKKLEESVRKAVHEREDLASTGVGMNVAIPHVKVEELKEVHCSLAVHQDGIEWQAVDGAPVHIIFMVLRPTEPTEDFDPDEHLEMMRWIARLAREPDFRGFALQARTKAELTGLLKEMAAV